MNLFCAFSKEHYDGLLEEWLDRIEPVLMRCGNCDHVFYKEMPDESLLSEMYSTLKRPSSSPDPSRAPSKVMICEMQKLLRIADKRALTFLDYGAGYGRWSEAAFIAGFEVVSFEPHVSRSEKSTRYDLINDQGLLDNRKFDVIWAEQVLEHVPFPNNTLKSIKRYMKVDSISRLSVPNIYS